MRQLKQVASKAVMRTDPVLARLDGFPDRLGADSNRSQQADSSNYNSA